VLPTLQIRPPRCPGRAHAMAAQTTTDKADAASPDACRMASPTLSRGGRQPVQIERSERRPDAPEHHGTARLHPVDGQPTPPRSTDPPPFELAWRRAGPAPSVTSWLTPSRASWPSMARFRVGRQQADRSPRSESESPRSCPRQIRRPARRLETWTTSFSHDGRPSRDGRLPSGGRGTTTRVAFVRTGDNRPMSVK
jgi:hypothetical protein